MIKRIVLFANLLLAAGGFLPAAADAATDYWFEDFNGLAGSQPTGWLDESDNAAFNVEISNGFHASWAAVTRTVDDVWGKTLSPLQSPDVALYPSVEVVVTGLSASTSWKIGIQEDGSSNRWDLCASQTGTGTFAFNYATITGWGSGTHQFRVELIVESATAGTYIEVDSVRISTVPTPTPTPTAVPVFWSETFAGTAFQPVPGWQVTDPPDTDFNARIFYSADGAYVAVTPSTTASFGKVLSPVLTVNTANNPLVEVTVLSLDKGAAWKLGIQEREFGYRHETLNSSMQRAGTFVFNYADVMGWSSGSHAFSLEIVVEGVRKKIELDSIRILNASALPTPVVTPTPYAAEFDLEAAPPAGWMYSLPYTPSPLTSTAGVLMYSQGGFAYLTFTALGDNLVGKALSTTITVDTDAFPELWFWVTDAYPFGGEYTVSLWTRNVGVFPIFTSGQNPTGLKKINYRELIRQEMPGWGGPQALNVELALAGESGSYFKMDYIRFQPAGPAPTITPTPVTNTLRPSANLFRPDQGPLTVTYMVQSTDTIRITVFNTAGRKVRTLLERNVSGQVSGAVDWDGKNEEGDWVGSGVYVIRIESKDLQNHTRFFKNVRVAVVR